MHTLLFGKVRQSHQWNVGFPQAPPSQWQYKRRAPNHVLLLLITTTLWSNMSYLLMQSS
nr:hypothetical protein [uncultured bacterium]